MVENLFPHIEKRILYEDNHLVAILKYPGEIVQGDKSGDISMRDTIKQYLKVRDHKPGNVFCGVIHRLDRPVSGVVLFAKTSKGLARMNKLLQKRDIKKTYWTLVRNSLIAKEGTIEGFFKKVSKLNKSYFFNIQVKGSQKGVLNYRTLQSFQSFHLLEIELLTGRHHQIRASLAALGSPVAGDVKYGDRRSFNDRSIALHARSIEFIHPVLRQFVKIVAPVPETEIWTRLIANNCDNPAPSIP